MKRIGLATLLLLFCVALALAVTTPPSPLAAADDWFEAVLFRFFAPALPPSDRIVIVGITEETLNQLAYRSPVDRGFLAQLLDTIEAAQPAAIGLDLLFDQPTEAEKDNALRLVLDKTRIPIVFAATDSSPFLSEERQRFRDTFIAGRRRGDVALLRTQNFDETIHRYRARGDHGLPSFAAALAEAVGVAPPRASFRIAWRRAAETAIPFPIYPAQLLSVLPPDWLHGKIVLIGSLVPGQDEHRTPVSLFAQPSFGVEIHAQALAQILDGSAKDAPSWIGPAAVALAAMIGFLLANAAEGVALIASLLVVLLAIWIGSVMLFAAGGPLIAPLRLTVAFGLVVAGLRFWHGRRAQRDHRVLGQMFARHVSAPVARELWRQREAFLAGGRPVPQELVATVLFADVAGFTTLCERFEPAPLIEWLDQYIDAMVAIIGANDGAVLRFVGDGILAVFGAPVPRQSETEIDADAQHATRCALAMIAAMRRLNEGWRAQGLPAAGLRVGLHTGALVAGCLGRGEKVEYCLLGDTANTGARIEALGKEHVSRPEECVVLVGASTYARLHGAFHAQAVGEVMLRGKEQPVGVYRILDEIPAIVL